MVSATSCPASHETVVTGPVFKFRLQKKKCGLIQRDLTDSEMSDIVVKQLAVGWQPTLDAMPQ